MLILIILLLIILACCSFMEISFSGLNIIRIKKIAEGNFKNSKKAKIIYNLYNRYSETLSSILIINCISNVFVSAFTTSYFSSIFGDEYLSLIAFGLTIVILIFTEIIPKILGREYSDIIAIRFAYILNILVILFWPINKVINLFERGIKNTHKVTATKEELVEIVKTIKDEGVLFEKESLFIQKAVILKELKVSNIMVDKDNVSFLYDTDSSKKVRDSVFRDQHARIPIINKNNKAIGVLYEVDLLDEMLNNGTISIKKSMSKPICVSKNSNLETCLELLNKERVHMALVTDKDNNFLGIVTMEDIITELTK